jgi:hypothetical protein
MMQPFITQVSFVQEGGEAPQAFASVLWVLPALTSSAGGRWPRVPGLPAPTGTSASPPAQGSLNDCGLGESIVGGGIDDTLRQLTYTIGLEGPPSLRTLTRCVPTGASMFSAHTITCQSCSLVLHIYSRAAEDDHGSAQQEVAEFCVLCYVRPVAVKPAVLQFAATEQQLLAFY